MRLVFFIIGTHIGHVYEDYFISIKSDILRYFSWLFLVLNTGVFCIIIFGLVTFFVRLNKEASAEIKGLNIKVRKLNNIINKEVK